MVSPEWAARFRAHGTDGAVMNDTGVQHPSVYNPRQMGINPLHMFPLILSFLQFCDDDH
jgi:hypothetical protein